MTNIAISRTPYVIGALPLLVTLIAIFVLGALSGFLVRPAGAPVLRPHAVSVCPASTHAVVWYTARTWECVQDPTN